MRRNILNRAHYDTFYAYSEYFWRKGYNVNKSGIMYLENISMYRFLLLLRQGMYHVKVNKNSKKR